MPTDALDLAKAFDAAAVAIKDRTFSDWDRLTPKQRQVLDDAFWDVTAAAMTLRTLGVAAILADAELSVKELSGLTARAKRALKQLDDIRKAIKVATALFGFVTTVTAAVTTGNVGAVGPVFASFKELLDALEP
jgi:hypothetical protein